VKAGEENIDNTFKSLIVSSGKMIVLDKLLEKLKEDCQRVVILSPMIRLLNIIGDYLEGVGISYQRLDGSEMCYDAEAFVFLVSRPDQPFEGTDTVIIFDSSVRPNCIKSCGKVYRFIAKGSFECEISELATKRIGVDQRTSGKELEKLLRLSAYQILNFREDESCDIDEILSHPVMAGSNLGVDIDVDDSDFWPNLLELPITGDFDREDDDILIQSDDCEVCPAVLPDLETSGDDRSVGQWRDFELAQLEKLLFWYGWGRWDDAHSLCGLNRDVPDMRVAGRAVLGWLINTAKELHDFLFAISLLDGAYSTEFDPTFDTREVSETLDAEFMKHAILVHPQFAQLSEGKGKWLKRLEIVTVVTMAVERAHRNLREIVVPELAAALPADWWTENDDRCLLYGTWKYGFSSYCRFKEDESILLSSNTLPPEPALTQRLRSLAFGIRRIYVIAPTSDRLPRLWTQRENGKVLKCLFRAGVPLKPDGSHDWVKLRECCRLADRTAEEIEKLVIGMMEIADFNEQHPGCDQDDDDDGRDDDGRDNGDDDDDNDGDADDSENGDDEETLGGITARRIRDRFNSLTRLRRLFMKFTEQEISEYFTFLPRRVGRPLRWTTPMEFLFFKEVCSRGWKVSGEILKMREFEGVFRGRPPSYLRRESKTIRRLNFILTFIEQNALETLRERRKPKPVLGRGVPANCLNPAPEICCDGNGALILPIGIAPTAFVIDLGRIVTDRPDFHSERYIFPAGFKSSRLYWSTINPSEKVWYTSEIVDTGDAMPLFRVTMDDHPEISIDGNSPFSPWQSIARRVAEARGQSGRGAALRERFGLSSPVICYLIQQMAGAETCVNYLMRSFAPPRIRVRKLNQPGAASLANPVDPEDAPSADLLPIPKIPYDENGAPSLPIWLSPTMFVSDLGHIVTDRPGFHTDRYIYPAGFKSTRRYWSTINPSQKVSYTSEIVDTGADVPLFRVTMKDHPEISFDGNSPSSPWNLIAKLVLGASGGKHGTCFLPGPDYIGLSSPVIRYLIQQMEGADKSLESEILRLA
jgi:chromodomain-helicase-DNA-binding protein 7